MKMGKRSLRMVKNMMMRISKKKNSTKMKRNSTKMMKNSRMMMKNSRMKKWRKKPRNKNLKRNPTLKKQFSRKEKPNNLLMTPCLISKNPRTKILTDSSGKMPSCIIERPKPNKRKNKERVGTRKRRKKLIMVPNRKAEELLIRKNLNIRILVC